jgi:hypothetical protein
VSPRPLHTSAFVGPSRAQSHWNRVHDDIRQAQGRFREKIHVREQKFRAESRRNKLLGLWATEKLGFTGDAALAYARDVVAADFEEAGDGDVVRKLLADLRAKDVAITEQAIRARMNNLAAQALAEAKAER